MTESEIKALANEALNEACFAIQTKLGVTCGGYASIHFSDNAVRRAFEDYIRSEIRFNCDD